MRSRIALAVAAALLSSAALAGPAPLNDAVLDRVTAGTAETLQGSGGAVVGNNSEAKLVLTGTLELAGEAQSGARALNAVNSSESTVANGVNVWDGKLDTVPDGDPSRLKFEVSQQNVVEQEQRRVALLPKYERSDFNESATWTEDSMQTRKATANTSRELRDVQSLATTRELSSSGSVTTETTVAGQTIRGGRGIAGAGDLDINFDGGAIDFSVGVNAGGLTGTLELGIELPELAIAFNGGGCAVQMGSCEGVGSLSETSESLTDNTTIETVASTEDSSRKFVGGGTKDVRSPFTMEDAQAEYLVVDDSKLDVESNYGVQLAGAAQRDLRALNAVNAAGSAVANAVNIARTPSMIGTQKMALMQSNVISHSR